MFDCGVFMCNSTPYTSWAGQAMESLLTWVGGMVWNGVAGEAARRRQCNVFKCGVQAHQAINRSPTQSTVLLLPGCKFLRAYFVSCFCFTAKLTGNDEFVFRLLFLQIVEVEEQRNSLQKAV